MKVANTCICTRIRADFCASDCARACASTRARACARAFACSALVGLGLFCGHLTAQPSAALGTEEFGLTSKQLVESIEKVEGLISKCMREQGFEYVAVDYNTVRRGMNADKKMPGLSEKEFFARFGFGVATTYTGQPPQLAAGYSPGKEGLGERNVQIYKKLSPTDQVAYNRALFGENLGATFAVGLETENFSMLGGCTRKSVAQVFKAQQMASTYYNPKDALVNNDPRMKAVIRKFAVEMRKAGFDYAHPDEVEADIRKRLNALSAGATLQVDKMTPSQLSALKELQDYERRVATRYLKMRDELLDPVADKIEEELFARKAQ